MAKKRSTLVALLTLVVIGAIAAWYFTLGPGRRGPEPPETQLETVTVAQVGEFFLYMPLYYAHERGYFRRHGLRIRFVTSGGDERSVAAVIAGAADFGVGDPAFAAIARERGQDVRVIGSVVNGMPFWGVAKSPAIPTISTPAQLRGHTVATFPRPSTAYTVQTEMFRRGGLNPSIREAAFGSLLPLLDSGAVDIVLELEPNVSTAVAQGGHVVYSMADAYPDFAITGVTATADRLTRRPDTARRFIAALDEAERAAHANPTDVVRFAQERFPTVNPQIAESAIRRMLESRVFPASANVSEAGWREAIRLRREIGDLHSDAAGDGVVDNRFVPHP